MSTRHLLSPILLATTVVPAHAQSVVQLYSYRLDQPAAFEAGYRAHLGWHARQRDSLPWYAWTVTSGPRRGLFIDGTAASLAALDARPDVAGDGADFAANAAPYATPIDVETWQLWQRPSHVTPLEDERPGAIVDVFMLEVAPGEASAFEQRLDSLRPAPNARLTWYRHMRGGGAATFMALFSRERWTDLDAAGYTFTDLLARSYLARPCALHQVLMHVGKVTVETWNYAPRLALLPGTPLSS